MQQLPKRVWSLSAESTVLESKNHIFLRCFKSNIKNLGPLCYLSGTLCADSWGEVFTRSVAPCPSQKVKRWRPAGGGSLFLPYLQQTPHTSLCVTSLFLSFPSCKIVDPVYCKAELIPHCKRLWDILSGKLCHKHRRITNFLYPASHVLTLVPRGSFDFPAKFKPSRRKTSFFVWPSRQCFDG